MDEDPAWQFTNSDPISQNHSRHGETQRSPCESLSRAGEAPCTGWGQRGLSGQRPARLLPTLHALPAWRTPESGQRASVTLLSLAEEGRWVWTSTRPLGGRRPELLPPSRTREEPGWALGPAALMPAQTARVKTDPRAGEARRGPGAKGKRDARARRTLGPDAGAGLSLAGGCCSRGLSNGLVAPGRAFVCEASEVLSLRGPPGTPRPSGGQGTHMGLHGAGHLAGRSGGQRDPEGGP